MILNYTKIGNFRMRLASFIKDNDIIVVKNGRNNREIDLIGLSVRGKVVTIEDMEIIQDLMRKINLRTLREAEQSKKKS